MLSIVNLYLSTENICSYAAGSAFRQGCLVCAAAFRSLPLVVRLRPLTLECWYVFTYYLKTFTLCPCQPSCMLTFFFLRCKC